MLAALPFSLEYMQPWQAGALLALLSAPIVLLGIRSLSGLGPVRRWVAVGVRLALLLVLVLILGGLRWQRQNKDLEVMVLRDVSQSTQNVTAFPGKSLSGSVEDYLKSASAPDQKPAEDRIGVVRFHSSSLIDAMPATTLTLDARAVPEQGNGTDVASAVQLSLASLHRDAMHRMLLIWDGNQTAGDLDAAISAAAAQGVPIDVMPLNYDVQNEVLVDRFTAPAWKREDEPFSIEVILRSTNPAPVSGKLTVTHNGQVMTSRIVTLQPGRNVQRVQVPPTVGSNLIHQFHAVFEGENVIAQIGDKPRSSAGGGDTLLQNNVADAFTFVRGKGRVL
ncbi:MAG: hypothetical protein ACREJC_06205, partial [Tepidisphaeraceae bacterium]